MAIKRVWVVSEVYYPEETGTAYFITKIAEALATQYSVTVLCGQPNYSQRGLRALNREHYKGVNILRCRSATLNKDRLAQRLVNMSTISMSIFVTALRSFGKGDPVLVVTNPPLLPFLVMLACWLRGAKYVLRMDDVYPDMLVATGLMTNRSPLFRTMNWFTAELYQRAERIIAVGRDMRERLASKMSRHRERIVVITNWADLDLISPEPKENNALLRELGLTNKFVVLWAGNMGHPHEIKSFFDAMVTLRDCLDVHFLIIGSGYKRPWLEAQVKEAQLKTVTLLGNRPRSDQPNFLNACDMTVSSFVKGMSGIGVPSRTYNALAAAKPILAIGEPDSEVALIIEDEKVGWLVPPGQPDRIVQTILWARDHPQVLAEMGKRGRLAAETKYSSAFVISEYLDLFDDMFKRATH